MIPSKLFTRSVRSLATASASTHQQTLRAASTLVVSEALVDGVTPAGTQSTVTAAQELGQPISLLVVGESAPTTVPSGVSKIIHVPLADARLSETVAAAIQSTTQSTDTSIVVGTSSKFGSTVLPRAAALLQVSPITDILEIHDSSKYTKENKATQQRVLRVALLLIFCHSLP